jgi:hypothetical protein
MAFHAPRTDEAVQAPKSRIRHWELGLYVCHEGPPSVRARVVEGPSHLVVGAACGFSTRS